LISTPCCCESRLASAPPSPCCTFPQLGRQGCLIHSRCKATHTIRALRSKLGNALVPVPLSPSSYIYALSAKGQIEHRGHIGQLALHGSAASNSSERAKRALSPCCFSTGRTRLADGRCGVDARSAPCFSAAARREPPPQHETIHSENTSIGGSCSLF
jgi:hypothetical protein